MVVTLLLFLVLGFSLNSERCVFGQADQIASKLQEANTAVGQAFKTVLEAEKAGGNVTQLLSKLNVAGELLVGAKNALNSGNIANLTSNVENVSQMANQINGEALNLRNISLGKSLNSLWLTLNFSIIGAVVFVFSLLVVWRRFKRGYIKKLLETKPEVVENTL